MFHETDNIPLSIPGYSPHSVCPSQKNIVMDVNNVMQCSHRKMFLEFFMQENQNILHQYSLLQMFVHWNVSQVI
jgi:hypothetical protein